MAAVQVLEGIVDSNNTFVAKLDEHQFSELRAALMRAQQSHGIGYTGNYSASNDDAHAYRTNQTGYWRGGGDPVPDKRDANFSILYCGQDTQDFQAQDTRLLNPTQYTPGLVFRIFYYEKLRSDVKEAIHAVARKAGFELKVKEAEPAIILA